MTEKRTIEEIIENALNYHLEQCCINIKDELQESELTLSDEQILRLADQFYTILHRQNAKVIVTGDGK